MFVDASIRNHPHHTIGQVRKASRMPQSMKMLIVAMMVFLAPIGFVVVTRWEALAQIVNVDPQTAEGTLIYFTSYG